MSRSVKFIALFVLMLGLLACGQSGEDSTSSANATDQAASAKTMGNDGNGASFSALEMNMSETRETGHFGFGQTASGAEIAGWDIDIRPDGMGLPEGSGSVEDGEMLYEEQCASCHGTFGEGADGYPKLAGGEGSLQEGRPEKTVGSYWPHTSTLWDYIHRAMPFQAPQSLEDDEVYALTAYVLYLNDLVEDDFELSNENFTEIELPNKNSFYRDDRPDVQATRCMQNCKDYEVEITSEPMNATYFTGELAKTVASESATDNVTAADSVETVEQSLGETTYQAACAVCHTAGVAGAPVTGAKEQWTERLAKGEEMLNQNAINGLGAMPAKGGNNQLSDESVIAAVSYMLQEIQ
ncbi:MAG: c-type cytochrome [Gammaproteobacteria bacterium]|nr:c-type cytochrome [Gammaproteobacteria bacterium]